MKQILSIGMALFLAGCQASAQKPDAAPTQTKTTPEAVQDPPTKKEGSQAAPVATMRAPTKEELARYAWLTADKQVRPLGDSIAPPAGYTRLPAEEGSFAAWLRGLPLRAPNTPVNYYNGGEARSANDPNVAAVVEIDVGAKDLQQCADSIIRLHGEWLWASKKADAAGYHFTSGDLATWKRYSAGERAKISGNKVSWVKSGAADSSYKAYRNYLNLVFTYAGTLSLQTYAKKVKREELAIGDFWVTGGSPGHTVIVLDIAQNEAGKKVALIGQGFLPAQDFHVLSPDDGDAWFSLEEDAIATPFWNPFPWTSLRRL